MSAELAKQAKPADPRAQDRGAEVHAYDFRRPNLISKDRLRALEAMYGRFCQDMESWLTTRVRGAIDLVTVDVDHMSFGEFTAALPSPCASYVFDVAGGGPQVVVDFGREFSFFLIDRLLGSSGEPPVPERGLTVVERLVVRVVADQMAHQLDGVWQDYVDLGLELKRFESVPEILRTANREDPMLVTRVAVRAPNLDGTATICVPFASVESFFLTSGSQRLQTRRGTDRDRDADRAAAEQVLRATGVTLVARTPAATITMRDLASLHPGTVLGTGLPAEPELEVSIEGTHRFVAVPGRAGRSLAVRITRPVAVDTGAPAEPTRSVGTMATVMPQEEDRAEPRERNGAGPGALGSLYDVTLPVSIELGRTRMSVQEVLGLGRGSVVALDRLVGEPVDVIVGDRRFAEAEVVVIGEQFGVRITRIFAAPNGSEAGK